MQLRQLLPASKLIPRRRSAEVRPGLASTPAATPWLTRRGRDCHGQGLTAGHHSTFRTIGPSVEVPRRLCVHNVCQHAESRRRQVRLSRQASASSLKLSQAPANMLGQCGSSSAKRCEHVEVTFSGWTCILSQGLEPALTQKSWLTTQKIKLTNFHPRPGPRSPAKKTRPGGPCWGWGRVHVWTDVRPFPGGREGVKGQLRERNTRPRKVLRDPLTELLVIS